MNEFKYGDQRQVQVNTRELGITYLPVIPYCGPAVDQWRNAVAPVTHAVTRVENGTIIRFLEVIGAEDEQMWIFALASSPSIQFLVPNSFKSYLWKFKMMPVRKMR